jgi:hypothetical protein
MIEQRNFSGTSRRLRRMIEQRNFSGTSRGLRRMIEQRSFSTGSLGLLDSGRSSRRFFLSDGRDIERRY